MGADIYLQSEIDKRDGLPYDEKYTDDCYFRDSYNETSLYWLLGRSWWSDVDLVDVDESYRDDQGNLTPEGISAKLDKQRSYLEAFRNEVGQFDEKFAKWIADKQTKGGVKLDSDDNSPAKWREMFHNKLTRWIALQERAISLGEPLMWSV